MPSSDRPARTNLLLTAIAATAILGATAAPAAAQSGASSIPEVQVSAAEDARAYRKDAAKHLYGHLRERIFKGRMPPLLYAVGVMQVEVDDQGLVRNFSWMRAPSHVPEVMVEIERMVRAAAPYPVPSKMGRVTYTDTWLWHKSGRFQLDTLTEGQD